MTAGLTAFRPLPAPSHLAHNALSLVGTTMTTTDAVRGRTVISADVTPTETASGAAQAAAADPTPERGPQSPDLSPEQAAERLCVTSLASTHLVMAR